MSTKHESNDKMRILNTVHDEERRINYLSGGYESIRLFNLFPRDMCTVDDDCVSAKLAGARGN